MNPIAIGLVFAACGAAQEIDGTRRALEACVPSGWRITLSTRNPTAYVIIAQPPDNIFRSVHIQVHPKFVSVAGFVNDFKNMANCSHIRSTEADEKKRKATDASWDRLWDLQLMNQQMLASMGSGSMRPDCENMRTVRTTANKLRDAVLDRRKAASPR